MLFTRFMEHHYASASSADQQLFVELLGWQDPELARYLLVGERHTDPSLAALIRRLRTA